MIENIIEAVVAALAASGIQSTATNVVDWVKAASSSVPSDEALDCDQVEKIAEDMASKGYFNLGSEMTLRNLARWFEIPEEEFRSTPKEQLEPEVLIRHISLEKMFGNWFKEWGYEVEIGEDLEGLEDIEFIPDIYAKRETLHGLFEVVVCLVCDNPPSIYRTRSKFETFESYARHGSEFGERDIFIVATPFQFGKGIAQSIVVQNQEEDYSVVALEGNDLYRLQAAKNSHARQQDLIQLVARARDKLIKNKVLFNTQNR